MDARECNAGQRVRVTQQIDRREGCWLTQVTGTVVSVGPAKTGSWYAHAKDGKYWLLRICLRKDDGEVTTVTVDPFTVVEPLSDAPVAGKPG